MFVDMLGNVRIKLCMHLHSAFSDGELTPPEIAEKYCAEGYDAIAVTDSWMFGEECELSGLLVLSGVEYDVGCDRENGIYHVVGIGMTSDPDIPYDWKNMKKTAASKTAQIVEKIRLYNGFSFIAHPVRCSNTARGLLECGSFDGLEIYSAQSALDSRDTSYAGMLACELATFGTLPHLVAADDAQDYADEMFGAYVMVEASEMDSANIVRALRAGRFYSTEGPEVHICCTVGGKVRVMCSPCARIELYTNFDDTEGKIFEGDGLIEAEYAIKDGEKFVRAEVTDSLGQRAWTNFVIID